jgi:RHS repeat-associated protein
MTRCRVSFAMLVVGLFVFAGLGGAAGSASARTFVVGNAKRRTTPAVHTNRVARATGSAATASQASPATGTEVVAMRTRNSDTFLTGKDYYKTVAYQDSINYGARGGWRPIDNSLVSSSTSGYAYENKANRYRVLFPSSLSAPVRVELGGSWVQFALVGGGGSASSSGATATYSNVLPGVGASYRVDSDQVKETLTLASVTAPMKFVYSLQMSAGLTANATAAGGINFVDSSGTAAFGFAPPSLRDAQGATSQAASLALTGASSVTLSLDPSWLTAASRRFPVAVDPSVVFFSAPEPGDGDTYLASGSPSTSFSGGPAVSVGFDGTSRYRSLFQFPAQNWFANVQVLNAQLMLNLQTATGTAATPVELHRMTRDWGAQANWNTSDGSTSWTTAGGDFASTATATTTVPATPGWNSWDITSLVRDWQHGAVPNLGGFALVQQGEATNQVLNFSSVWSPLSTLRPHLVVLWQAWLGQKPWYTMLTQQLTDRMAVHVNVGNGNMMVENQDAHIGSTGQDMTVGRWFNANSGITGDLGNQWLMTTGRDVGLWTLANGSVIYFGPSGAQELFTKNGDGSFASPPGSSREQLSYDSGTSSYTLKFNASGDVWTFSSIGKLLNQKDKNGNTTTINYDPSNGAIASITDTRGRQTSITYDNRGYISSITDPAGRTYQYARAAGIDNLVTYTDPASKTIQYGYGTTPGNYNLLQVTDPLGNITSFTYDDINRVSSITRQTAPDGSGPAWHFDYKWVYATLADPRCPSVSVLLTIVTDPRGGQMIYCSDSLARVVRTIDPLGHTTSTSYTLDSEVQSETDALGHTTTYAYDQLNNLISVTSPLAAKDQYGYTNTAHPYSLSDYYDPQYVSGQSGHRWHYAYDQNTGNTQGNLTSLTPEGQQPVSFAYNSNGTLASATDANGQTTTYGYDTQGNRTLITPPAPLGAVAITYDSLSRIHTITGGNGQMRTYSYDPLDRVTQIEYTNGPTLTYTYDADGNVTYTSDPSGTYGYSYDALNRLTQQVGPIASIAYAYDAASNLTGLTDGSGTTTYTYDADNRLANLTEPGASTAIGFEYDANGNRTQISYPNNITEVVQYDNSQRLTRVYAERPLGSGNILASFIYSYSSGGADTALRQSVDFQYPGDGSATAVNYSYDTLDRLTGASGGGHNYSYAYGPNGNMTSQTIDGTTTTYSYTGANELNGTGYSYDANGSMTSDASVFSSATYNRLAQLSSITPTGGNPIAMAYNGIGESRRVTNGTNGQVNDLLGLNRDTGSPDTYYTRDNGGTILGERRSGNSYYLLIDGLGSTAAVTDSSGNVATSYKYDPYGNTTCTAGTQSCNFYEPIRYAGGYWDGNLSSGEQLYKFGERYYDPSLGRWTSIDPADNPLDLQGWNQYKYAGDDPVNNVDPSGLAIGGQGGEQSIRTICGYRSSMNTVVEFVNGGGVWHTCALPDRWSWAACATVGIPVGLGGKAWREGAKVLSYVVRNSPKSGGGNPWLWAAAAAFGCFKYGLNPS